MCVQQDLNMDYSYIILKSVSLHQNYKIVLKIENYIFIYFNKHLPSSLSIMHWPSLNSALNNIYEKTIWKRYKSLRNKALILKEKGT